MMNLIWMLLFGCTGPATTTPVDSAQPVVAKEPKGTTLTEFEESLLRPIIKDIQAGVQPWDEQSVGICSGSSGLECAEYVGRDGGTLPEGEYKLRGEFRVPNIGEKGTWKVKLDLKCENVRILGNGETTTNNREYSKEWDVRYAGKNRGSRLSPMYKISSPARAGQETCNWTVSTIAGEKTEEWKGSWKTKEQPKG